MEAWWVFYALHCTFVSNVYKIHFLGLTNESDLTDVLPKGNSFVNQMTYCKWAGEAAESCLSEDVS